MGAPVSQVEVKQAITAEDFAAARVLIEAYAVELDVDLCFQDFAEEIAHLPGMYGPPDGCLLLARTDGELVGCVAIRQHDAASCEMKRLYVQPQHRGTGLGRRLAELAISAAKTLGYEQILLDTLPDMSEAQALYASLGFKEISSYYRNPLAGVRYFACSLESREAE
jgi:ribosomal protein S18 acetylase RimI-like enzyme